MLSLFREVKLILKAVNHSGHGEHGERHEFQAFSSPHPVDSQAI
jgi:hypothetical protein